MGKKKGFKIKTIKVPQEKFLVITNAWGLSTTADVQPEHLNNVSAWFEIMLSERHPGVTLRSLYHQRTHKNLIVELPREVADISPYLGRHNYAQFTTNSPQSEQYAEIFEYKYSRYGDPAEKNWTVGYPTYAKIPPNIPIRRPYPVPKLASPPPIDVKDYAYPVPPEVYTQRVALLVQPNRDAERTTTKDADLLKCSPPLDASLSKTASNSHSASSSQWSLPVEIETAEDFLANLSFRQPVVKGEPATDDADTIFQSVQEEDEGDDYVPSNELLSMLADLPPNLDLLDAESEEVEESTIKVKPEPVDNQFDYVPSQELFDLMTSLHQKPDGELQAGAMSEIKQEQSDSGAVEALGFRVKPEPMDDFTIHDSYDSSYLNVSVKAEDTTRSIKSEDSEAGIRIKPEPMETTLPTKSSRRENTTMEAANAVKIRHSRSPSPVMVKSEVIEERFSYEMSPKGDHHDNYVKRERGSDRPHSKYERTAVSQRPLSTSSSHHSNQYDDYKKAIKRERSLSQGTNSRYIKSVKRG